jgi:hypothetical protein
MFVRTFGPTDRSIAATSRVPAAEVFEKAIPPLPDTPLFTGIEHCAVA